MISILYDILYVLGGYSPIVLIFLTIYLLLSKKKLIFYYIIGIFFNTILNIILKGILQEPRPIYENKKVYLALTHGNMLFNQNGLIFDVFGMPSGHAQSAFFSTVFIYLTLQKNNITSIFLFFSILTCIQRVSSNYHSINQVIIGSLIGSLFAFFIYYIILDNYKGRFRSKPDDNYFN